MESLTDNAFWAATYNAYDWYNGQLSLSNPVINWPWENPSDQLWPDFWQGVRFSNIAIESFPKATKISEKRKKYVDCGGARITLLVLYEFASNFTVPFRG